MCSKGLGAKARIETNADFTANTGLIASIGLITDKMDNKFTFIRKSFSDNKKLELDYG